MICHLTVHTKRFVATYCSDLSLLVICTSHVHERHKFFNSELLKAQQAKLREEEEKLKKGEELKQKGLFK